MKKILITGATGGVGSHFIHELGQKYDITGCFNSSIPNKKWACKWTSLDLESTQAFKHIEKDFDYVIHLAAESHPEKCEADPKRSNRINYEGLVKAADFASECQAKLIFSSTDVVFSGGQGPYTETDAVNPISYYSEHKAMAEEFLLSQMPESLIPRLTVQIIPVIAKGFYHLLHSNLSQGKVVSAFTDEIRNFNFTDDTVKWMDQLKEESGLIHFGYKESMSRYEFALKFADTFKYNNQLVKGISSDSIDFKAKRSKDVTMDVTLLESKVGTLNRVEERLKILSEA